MITGIAGGDFSLELGRFCLESEPIEKGFQP
jgi:hypothetical protein